MHKCNVKLMYILEKYFLEFLVHHLRFSNFLNFMKNSKRLKMIKKFEK